MKNTIVVTEFEADAIQLAAERRQVAQVALDVAAKNLDAKIKRVVAAHELAPIPDGIGIDFRMVGGRFVIEWEQDVETMKDVKAAAPIHDEAPTESESTVVGSSNGRR